MHVDVIGQSIIIINSSKIAKELMDKRSSIYSDRPHFVSALCSSAITKMTEVAFRSWPVSCEYEQSVKPSTSC